MPTQRKDSHSGAIIFDLTPSEIEVNNLKDTVASLTQEIASIKEILANTSNTSTNKSK